MPPFPELSSSRSPQDADCEPEMAEPGAADRLIGGSFFAQGSGKHRQATPLDDTSTGGVVLRFAQGYRM